MTATTTQHLRAAANSVLNADPDRVMSELSALRNDLERVLGMMTDASSTAITSARQRGTVAIDRIGTQAGALADDLGERGQEQAAKLRGRVRSQPLLALGVAFGAGLLFGALTARR